MKLAAAVLLLAAAAPAVIDSMSGSAQNQPADPAPFAWGDTGQNTGCVIFAEGNAHSSNFRDEGSGTAVTVHITGKLTLIEAINYTMDQKVIVETPANMDALMHRAHKDRVKYVKIPAKYTQDQLSQARSMCEPSISVLP